MESRTGTIVLLRQEPFSGQPCIGVIRTTHFTGKNEVVTPDGLHLTVGSEDIIPLCQTKDQEQRVVENEGPELVRDILKRHANEILGVYASLWHALRRSRIPELTDALIETPEPVHT